jgi:type IV pilus assembly protein PilM
MAFFGTPNAYLGLDVGTSSLKLVELVDRKKRHELVTYAQANVPNILLHPGKNEEEAIQRMATLVARMMDRASVSTDVVVAALPSSIVFSTVLMLPALSDTELDKAVHFAARDIVPADLEEMVLGWSRVGFDPHMDTDHSSSATPAPIAASALTAATTIPIFLTAAPVNVVNRYSKLMERLKLQLLALEVETFPLARSLLTGPADTSLIVDIGDLTTAFHIIDKGTPQVSYTVEYGGRHITTKLAQSLGITEEQAEQQKVKFGLSKDAPQAVQLASQAAVQELIDKARSFLQQYTTQYQRPIRKTVLIGGGANLRELKDVWAKVFGHATMIGNPWRGLSYPAELENRLMTLGPTYAVAIGLAMRGLHKVQ